MRSRDLSTYIRTFVCIKLLIAILEKFKQDFRSTSQILGNNKNRNKIPEKNKKTSSEMNLKVN